MSKTTDEAEFCFDLVLDGCPLHASNGKTFVCKPNGNKWLNAMVVNIVRFPDSEIVDDEVASSFTRIWLEQQDWLDLNLEPNIGQDTAYDTLYEIVRTGRQLPENEMDRLIKACSRRKYSEAMRELGF